MQGLVEALPRVRLKLDGVCGRGGDPAQRADEEGGGGEAHCGLGPGSCWIGLNWRVEEGVVVGKELVDCLVDSAHAQGVN